MFLRSIARSLAANRGCQALLADAISARGAEAATQGGALRFLTSGAPAWQAADLEPTLPAEPGTVAHHSHQVFVRLPHPADDAPADDNAEPWWPPIVEKEPGIVAAYSAVASALKESPELGIGPVKVNACIELGDDGVKTNDVLVFPQGVEYQGLSDSQVRKAVQFHLQIPNTDAIENTAGPPPGLPEPFDLQDVMCIFVCCHGSRDRRCGVHGVELSKRLKQEVDKLVHNEDIQTGDIRVFQCSHIGGHKYAGNVLVHGLFSPYDGDWFGGLRAEDAGQFLNSLLMLPEDCGGGHDNPVLRKWWRGRIGMTKEEQFQIYTNPEACEVCGEGDEEGGYGDSEEEEDSDEDEEDDEAPAVEQLLGAKPMDDADVARVMAELEAEARAGVGTRELDLGNPRMPAEGGKQEADDFSQEEVQKMTEAFANLSPDERQQVFDQLAAVLTKEQYEELLDELSTYLTEEEQQKVSGSNEDTSVVLNEALERQKLYDEIAEVSANMSANERQEFIEALKQMEGMSGEELEELRQELQDAAEEEIQRGRNPKE